jgi:tetratricopeptide (TPR) repeat protein
LPPRIDNSFFIFFHKFLKVADGNPRLLEWLMALALRTDGIQGVIDDAFLDRLGAEVSRFRESILAKTLLGALSGPERKALARMILFELAVPMAVVAELAQGASLESALSLGLLERQVAHGEELYRVTTVLEPLLQPALSEAEWSEARRRAARKLHKVWWDDPEAPREARGLEAVRVAVAAAERELAVGPADAIATAWVNRSRYQEALALCRLVLAAFDDYRILGTIARAEEVLGDTGSAKSHYERALSGCPPSDERRKSATIHNLAGLEAQQGEIERALQLWQQSLEILERIGDEQGKAATLANMAGVIAQQGEIERALQLWQQSLEIKERIGDVQGKAATLAQMAWAAGQSGDHAHRDRLNRQAAQALGSIRAYLDLITVLGNLGASAQQEREIFAAQAAWLVLRVQAPVDRSLQVLGLLFNLVAQGDPLEPLLGAAATIVVATCGGNHPQREKLLEKAGNLLSIAAGNAGIQSPEAYQQWFAQNRLADRAHVFPRLLALLEQRIAGSWLFDRAPLREHGDSSSAG